MDGGVGLQGSSERSRMVVKRREDEIRSPFNVLLNNCVDKRRELPSAGMPWHLNN